MYVTEYFSLRSEHLTKLAMMTPEFGYDGFGEIVFFRTYSRIKHDGNQENWFDVVVRVINGCMSIRKDWHKKASISWDEEYWQDYAFRMALAMFQMHWLPAGRGMWAMGTQFVYERGSMALNNCFSRNTKIIANDQPQAIGKLVGQYIGVWTKEGRKRAEVKSFGEQSLYNIVLKPRNGNSKFRLTYQATRNHRWLTDSGETTHLKEGDVITISPNKVSTDSSEYEDGFAHGLIFADGCNFYKNNYYIQLCGWKENYRDCLEHSRWYSHTIATEQRLILQSDVALKALPDEDTSLHYHQGFFDAWKLFDGHWKKESYCLDTINTDAVQWVQDHSGLLNYVMVGHSVENTPTNFGPRNKPLHRIKLRFKAIKFIVDSIKFANVKEEVYCVVEPETQSFMLAGGVITGNCGATKLGSNDRLSNDLHWLMDALMLGVGVGFEPLRDDLKIYKPVGEFTHYIGDSREGWCDSMRMLVDAYTKPGKRKPKFKDDYVRPKGAPIRGFGGLSSGPGPLMHLFRRTEELFETPGIDVVRLKTDIANEIGCTVVAGNVRRSAELCKIKIFDKIAMDLKDYDLYPERENWGWMSNNACDLFEDEEFEAMDEVAKRVVIRGEPGVINRRNLIYGRIGKQIQPREDKADLFNPCGEIPLEDKELCNVVETLPTMCPNVETWYKACEFAATYAQSVSLLPTHREETNRVVVKNRRIGVSIIDWTGWVHTKGLHKVTAYMRKGYATVVEAATKRAEETGVPAPIRFTTIKPGGTGPKLPGKTSGIGYPTFRHTLRRMRVASNNPICPILDEANVPFEPCFFDPAGTRVYEYPTIQGPAQPADEVSLWEQANNLVTVQREWSDNAVSNTLYFKPKWKLVLMRTTIPRLGNRERQFTTDFPCFVGTELVDYFSEPPLSMFIEPKAFEVIQTGQYRIKVKKNRFGEWELYIYRYDPNHEEGIIGKVLSSIAPLIKSCSVLPHTAKGAYRQMPEEGLSEDEYLDRKSKIKKIDWSSFCGSDGLDQKYCDGDACEVQ